MPACTLCGLPVDGRPVRDDAADGTFCCRGCLAVHRAVDDVPADGHDALSEDANGGPGGPEALAAAIESAGGGRAGHDAERGTGTAATAGSADGPAAGREDDRLETAFLSLEGMHCTACERFLERRATATDGVAAARASYATELIRVRYDPDVIGRDDLPDAIGGFGYRASDPEAEREGPRRALGRYRAVLAALLAMPVMLPYLLFVYPTYLGIYPASFLYGPTVRTMVLAPLAVWSTLIVLGLGYPVFRSAAISMRVGRPNVDVLVSIAVCSAYAYSVAALAVGSHHLYFDVAALVLVVVTVGNHVESRVKRRAIDARADLAGTRETTVRTLDEDGSVADVDPSACEPGDRVLVRAGERVPFDGTVVDGAGTVDEALVTGESIPRSVSVGDDAIGGSIVAAGSIVVEVGEAAANTLDRLVDRLWNVQSADAGAQRFVNAVAVAFVPLVLVIAVAAAACWLAAGRPPNEALLIGLSVLVVSCPCSLGIATPLALAAGSGRAAEEGAVVLSPNVLERITDAEVVVFDKTGTLTTGEMAVEGIVAADASPERVLDRAAAVETRSSHPIAEAIVDAATDARDHGASGRRAGARVDGGEGELWGDGDVVARGANADDAERTVESFATGDRTVSAIVDGCRVRVGDPAAFDADSWEMPTRVADGVEDVRDRGARPVVVGWDGVPRGVLEIRDEPRANWRAVVSTLAADERRIVVLTGDDERATRWLAGHPDVDDVFAGVRPASKEAIVRRLRREGTTAVIGDGTNDAPALAAADMGIAVESGTDLALDAADVAVLDDDLETIPAAFDVSRRTRRRIRRNLGWAVGYNAVAVPLAAAGYVNPLVAAALMGVSSLVVVANSGRDAVGRGPSETATGSRERVQPANSDGGGGDRHGEDVGAAPSTVE